MSATLFKAQIKQMFEVADANSDNVLEIDEFKQFTLFVLEALHGLVAHDPTTIDDLFTKFDTNKDGLLDWNEIWASMETIEKALKIDAETKRFQLGPGATFMEGTPDIVFVLGGPGSGKGTQCAKLVKEFNFMHLSAGDLLRAERDREGAQANMINNFMKEGKIVPASVTVNLIKQAMEKAGWADRKYLVDGFPRNAENYEAFFSAMTGHCNVKRAIHFTCSEAILTERILERAKTSGRVDDNEETLKLRFATYRN